MSGDKRQEQLLEQYKLFVGSSESLVSRRQAENRFYLTANTLVLGAIGLFLRDTGDTTLRAASIIGLAVVGTIVSYAWFRTIQSYQQLNTGKFAVIHDLEQQLPASLFKAEWLALGEGKNKRSYRPFTSTEKRAPWAFVVVHIAAIVLGILVATGTVGSSPANDAGSTVICVRDGERLNCTESSSPSSNQGKVE